MEEDILIIEDDSFLRNICVKHLARDGRTVRTARNGKEGIEELKKKQPHLLLLDLLLPHVDGFTVLEFIQQMEYTFPTIILSNIQWAFDKKGPTTIGATEYLIKSNVEIPELIDKIEGYLNPNENGKVR